MTDLAERIQARLKAVGINATSASTKAGLGKDYIRDITRGHKATISSKAAVAPSATDSLAAASRASAPAMMAVAQPI